MPRLTEYERHRVDEAKAVSAEALGKAAAEIRARHDRALAEKISAKSGMPLVSALRLVAARHRGVLLPYLELDFDHLGMVPVADVLADPIDSSARRWPIRWKAPTTDAARPRSCGPTMAACSSTASPMVGRSICSGTTRGRPKPR